MCTELLYSHGIQLLLTIYRRYLPIIFVVFLLFQAFRLYSLNPRHTSMSSLSYFNTILVCDIEIFKIV